MIIDKKKMRPLLWLIVIMISSNKKTNIVIILQHVQQEIELRNQVHTKSNAGEWLWSTCLHGLVLASKIPENKLIQLNFFRNCVILLSKFLRCSKMFFNSLKFGKSSNKGARWSALFKFHHTDMTAWGRFWWLHCVVYWTVPQTDYIAKIPIMIPDII